MMTECQFTGEKFEKINFIEIDTEIYNDFKKFNNKQEKIKNETEISAGATSVSFASVQYILNNVENVLWPL